MNFNNTVSSIGYSNTIVKNNQPYNLWFHKVYSKFLIYSVLTGETDTETCNEMLHVNQLFKVVVIFIDLVIETINQSNLHIDCPFQS